MPNNEKGTCRDVFKTFKYSISLNKLLVAFIAVVWFNILDFVCFGGNSIGGNVYRSITDAFYWLFSNNDLVMSAKAFLSIPSAFIPTYAANTAFGLKVLYTILFYLGAWIPIAFLIGVITRISAVQVARDENIGLKESFGFAQRKYLAFFLPIVLVFAVFGLVGIGFNLVIGLAGYIPYAGEILVPVLYPVAAIFGLLAVVAIVFGLLGFPLMAPTISVEGQDAFDALSRSYHYSVQRLGKYVVCLALLFFFLVPCTWFMSTVIIDKIEKVTLSSFQTLGLDEKEMPVIDGKGDEKVMTPDQYDRMMAAYTKWPSRSKYVITVEDKETAQVEKGPFFVRDDEELKQFLAQGKLNDPVVREIQLSGSEEVGGFILMGWIKALRYLVGAFVLCFLLTGSTIIYFILRKQIDGAEVYDVFIEGEDEEFEFGDFEETTEKTDNEKSGE